MKKKILQTIIRFIFGLFLIYKAYPETGIWTSIIFFLVLLNNELLYWTSLLTNNIADFILEEHRNKWKKMAKK